MIQSVIKSINLIRRKYILPPGVCMKSPLIYDQKDFKWTLLGEILKIFDSRRTRQEIAKQGIKPVNKATIMLKIVLISIYFSKDISYVLKESKNRPELRKFANIGQVPDDIELSRFISQFNDEQFINLVLMILNTISQPRRHRKAWIIVDSTDIRLDLNWLRRKITKKSLEEREFKWGYSSSKGFYIGYKLTLAIDYQSRKPLAFLIHEGSPHDSKIFTEILEELRRRRLLRRGDTVIMDKGYYSYQNYQISVSKYQIVPLIFPKNNFKLKKALDTLSYPLQVYRHSKLNMKIKRFFSDLLNDFKDKISSWQRFKKIRSIIEDMFKLAKKSLSLEKIHRYTQKSVTKHASLNVLLLGTIITLGYNSKKQLQTLAES